MLQNRNGVPWDQDTEPFLPACYEGVVQYLRFKIDEFVDVNPAELAIMRMWNEFILKRNPGWSSWVHLPELCLSFLSLNGKRIILAGLHFNAMLMMCTFERIGLIDSVLLRELAVYLNQVEKDLELGGQEEPPPLPKDENNSQAPADEEQESEGQNLIDEEQESGGQNLKGEKEESEGQKLNDEAQPTRAHVNDVSNLAQPFLSEDVKDPDHLADISSKFENKVQHNSTSSPISSSGMKGPDWMSDYTKFLESLGSERCVQTDDEESELEDGADLGKGKDSQAGPEDHVQYRISNQDSKENVP